MAFALKSGALITTGTLLDRKLRLRGLSSHRQDSLRINQDRYDGGLTTVTDLLGAEESTRRSQTDYWEAVYRFQTSYAGLELASGTLSLQSPVVMP
jgi:outer membrane protein TolC